MAEQEEPDGFAVVEILGTTIKHGKRHYKVRWADSWEPEENLAGCPQMIEDFWKKNKSEKRSKGSITRNKRKRTRQLRGDTPPASPPPNHNDTDSSDESDDSDDQPLGKTNKRKQRTKKNKRPRVESTSSSGDARQQGGEERAEENSLDNEITENTTSLGNSNQQEKLQAPMIGFGDQETSTDMNIDNEPTFDDTGEPPPIEEINAPNSSTTQRPTTPSISPVDNNIQPPPIEEINAGAPQIHYQKETSKDGNEEEEPTMQQLAQISNDSLLPLDTPVCQASSLRVKDASPNSTSAQKTENQPPFATTTAATSTSTTFSSLTRANQRLAASNNRQNCIDVDEVYTDDVTSKILEEKIVVVKKEPLSEPEDEELSFKRTAKIKAGFTIRKLAEKELDTQESSDSNEEDEYVQQPEEDDQDDDDISADDSNGTNRREEQQRVNSAMPTSSFQSAMETLLTLNVTTVQSQQHQRISSFTNTKAPTTTTITSFRCPTGAITNTFASIRPTLITSTTSCGSASTIVSFQSRPLPVPKGPVPDDNPEMARTFERFQKWSQFQQKELLTVSIKAVAKQVFTSKETSDGSIKTRINNWLTDRIRKKFGRQPGNAILNHPTYSQIVDNLAAKVFEAVKHIFKQSGSSDQKQDQGPQLVALSSGSNVPQPRPSNLQQPQGSHQRHPLPNILRPRQPPTPPAQHQTQQPQQHPISQLQQLSQQPRSVAMCPIPIAVDPQLPPYDLNDPQTQMQSQVMHRFASVHQQMNLQHLYTDPRLIPGSQPALYHNAHFQPIPGARPIGPIHSQQQPIQSIGIRMGQTSIRAQQPRLTHLNIQQPSQSGIRVGLSPDGTQQRVRYPGVFPTQQRNIQTSQIVTGTNQHSRENNPQRINASIASQQPNRHQVNIMRGTHPTSPPANQQLPRPSFSAVRHPSPPSGGSNQQQLIHQNQQQLPQRTQFSSTNHAQLPQRTQYSSANHAQQRHPFPPLTNNPQNSRSSVYTQGPTSMIKTARPQGSAQFNQRLPTQQNQNQNRFPRPNPQQAPVVQQQTHFHPRVVNFGKLHSFRINDLMGELTNLSTESQSSTHQSSQAVQPVQNITQDQRSPQSFQQQPPTMFNRTPTSQIVTSQKSLQKQPLESLNQRVQPVPAQILQHVTPTSKSQAPSSSTQQTPPVTSQQAPTATTVITNQQTFQPPSTSSLPTIAATIVSESQQQSSSTTTSTGPRIKHTNPTASIKRYIPRKSFKGPALSFQDRQYEAGEMTPALRDDFMIPSIPPISLPEMPEEEDNPLEFSDIVSPSSPRANDIPIDTSCSNEKKTTPEKQESKDPGEPVMAMETNSANLDDIETDLTDQTDNTTAPTVASQSPSKPQSKDPEATPMSQELESSSINDKDTATILASDSQLSSSEESQCMDEPIQSPGQPPIMAMEIDESESDFSSGKTNDVVNSTVIDNELLTKSKDSDTEMPENKTADICSTIEESNKDRNIHSDTEMSENTTQESSANTSSATEESNKTDKDLSIGASEPKPSSPKASESNKDDCRKDEKELLEESKATEDDETEITDQEALAIAGCLGLDPSDNSPEPDNEIQGTKRVDQETEGVDQETEGADQASERKDQVTEGVDQTDSPKDDSDEEITIINSKSTPVPERKPPPERVGGSGLSFTAEEEDVPHSVTSYIKRHYQSILDMVGDKRSSLGPKLHLHSDGSIEISLKEGGYIRIRYKDLVRADHERKARLRQTANTTAGSALRAQNAVVLIDESTTSATTDNTGKLGGSKETMSDSTQPDTSRKTNMESKRFGPGLIKKEKSPNRNTEKNETLLITQTGNSNDSTSTTHSINTVTKGDTNNKNRSVNIESDNTSTTIKDKTGIKTSNKSDENFTAKQTQNLDKMNENLSTRNDIKDNERTQNMLDDIDVTKISKQENLKFDIKGSSTSQNSNEVNLAINTSKDTLKSNDESSTKSGGSNSLSNETPSNTDNSDSAPEHRKVDKKDSSKGIFSKDETKNSTANHSGSDIKNKDHTSMDERIIKENLNELNDSPVMNENELLDFDDSDGNDEDMDDKLLTEDQLLGNDDEDEDGVEMTSSTVQSDTSKPEKSENLNIEKKDFVSKTEITKSCQETTEVDTGIRITRIIDTEVKKSAVAASTGELSSNSSKSIAQGSGTIESSNKELNRTNMDTPGSKATEQKLDSKTMNNTRVDSLDLDFETDQIASSPNLKSWEPNLNIDSTPTKNQSDVNKNIQSDSSKFDHVTSRNQSERSKSVDRNKQSSTSSKFKGVNLPFL
ncbi:serine-rich adhesin for platelets-like [Clytia hemisphaerica]|uniref:Chromo domain-containing protein n=1 Tax=Clytia hemisphaerica TaxID=252671 RepID=A0A7M5UDY3_9CNID